MCLESEKEDAEMIIAFIVSTMIVIDLISVFTNYRQICI
jgi:hypothetical protein